MMLGIAIFTIVVSSRIMKNPRLRKTSTSHGFALVLMACGGVAMKTSCDLTEREAVCLDARIEEFDLEGSILNAAPLADQLVEPLIIRSALALTIDVGSMGCACGLAIDKDAKPHRSGTFGRSHDQVDVTGMKAKGDTPVRLVENCCPSRDRPKSRYGPIIQVQTAGNCIGARLVRDGTTGRGKTFRLLVAGVSLSRLEGGRFGGNLGSLRFDSYHVIAE